MFFLEKMKLNSLFFNEKNNQSGFFGQSVTRFYWIIETNVPIFEKHKRILAVFSSLYICNFKLTYAQLVV